MSAVASGKWEHLPLATERAAQCGANVKKNNVPKGTESEKKE